jgi:hypothetical protein
MPALFQPKGPLNAWTLEVLGGATQSLAAWGLEACHLFDGSLQVGQFTASRPVQKIEDAPICPFGAKVILRDHNGIVRFIGKRVDLDQQASGPAEHQLYRFANAWWDLTKRVFHQTWTTWTQAGGQDPVASQTFNPHAILNVGRSVGQEINDIIAYAATQGVDIAVGFIQANVFPPADEIINRDCASVIAQLLAFAPDNVCWFEYPDEAGATTPFFHCREPLDVRPLALPNTAEDFSIRARHEDLATAVAIRYERTDQLTVNGVTRDYPVVFPDIWPPGATGREERALSETVQLAGFSSTFVTAQLLCASFPANFETGAALAFWSRFFPKLSDDRVVRDNPLITPLSFIRTAEELGDGQPPEAMVAHPRYLIAGEIAPWMLDSTGGALAYQKQVFSAAFNFTLYEQNADAIAGSQFGTITKARNLRLPVKLTATNAPAGVSNYSTKTAFAEGEQPPIGLAQYLYERLSVLGYSGRHRRIQSECDRSVQLGDLLNVSGGAPEWATMEAIVQSIDENIDDGETTIQFGVAPGLSLGRILELLRNARTRRRWTALEQQTAGTIAGANSIEFGRTTADSNSIPGLNTATFYAVKDLTKKITLDAGTDHQLRLEKSDAPGQFIQAQLTDPGKALLKLLGTGGEVTIDTADCLYLGVARTLRVKAVKSCDPTDPPGSNWVRLVLCTDRIRL